jgi:hypothetical protein
MDANVKFKEIASALVSEHPFEKDGDLLSFEAEDSQKRYQAVFKSTFDPSVNLFCSLPTVTRNIFVAVSDGPALLLRRALATAEDIERSSDVRLGNVLPLDDPELNENGIAGLLFLQGSVFNALEGLPDEIWLGGNVFKFLSVIFLTRNELKIWGQEGHDALMDHFLEVERDIVSFGGSANK